MRSFLDRIYGPQRRQDGRTYSTPSDQIRYEDLAAAYLSAEHHVTVLIPAEYKALKDQVSDRLAAHSEILESVVLDNVQLKGRVKDLERQNATILEAAEALKAVTEHPLRLERLRERGHQAERDGSPGRRPGSGLPISVSWLFPRPP